MSFANFLSDEVDVAPIILDGQTYRHYSNYEFNVEWSIKELQNILMLQAQRVGILVAPNANDIHGYPISNAVAVYCTQQGREALENLRKHQQAAFSNQSGQEFS